LIFYNQEDDYSVHEYQKDKEIDNTDSLNLTKYSKENEITFTKYSHNYCICIISIVDFTQNIDKLQNPVDIRKYYSIFYNTMALIIKNHDGKVIKNVGDLLLFYFPKTVNFSKPSSFQDVLDCGLAMIQANSTLNENLHGNGLPSISYRISANYGLVELATSTNSNGVDLFGPTVNICSKINHLALPNQMVIHKDLYDVIKGLTFFKEYRFEEIKNYKNNFVNKEKSVYSLYYTNKEIIKENSSIVSLIKGDSQYKEYPQQVINNSNNNQIQRKDGKSQKHDNDDNSLFKILLIDDNEDILFLFTSILDDEGYRTTSISNPVKALNYFSQIDPYYYDLIVMDVLMPGMNGIQLYSKIKIMNPDIKVLFLSALDAVEELLSIFPEVKPSEIIRKPIESKDLLSKINTILKS